MRLSKKVPDLTEGPLFIRLFLFAIPIMLTGLLQIFYNMADNIVVSKWSGDALALAAVGCTGTFTAILVNLLLGIANGASIAVAKFFGAKEDKQVSDSVHTSMTFSLLGGLFFALLGLIISKPFLTMLGTKPELMSRSLLYVRIICIGVPASSVYNFGAAILRATGNSRVPLFILASSGMINVLLNLFFVIVCNMSVSGVAIATISSQYLSAIAVVLYLMTRKGKSYQLIPEKLGIKTPHLKRILMIGIPSGVQQSMYTVGNMLLASAINTFPTTTITANSIAGNIDSIMLQSVACYGTACLTFSGQNYGAKKPERMKKVLLYTTLQALVMGFISATLLRLCSGGIISLYLPADAAFRDEIVAAVNTILGIMLYSYLINSVNSTFNAVINSLGYTFMTMTSGIICICGVRAIWVFGIFSKIGTLRNLYFVYPVSYTISTAVAMIIYLVVFGKAKREMLNSRAASANAESEIEESEKKTAVAE